MYHYKVNTKTKYLSSQFNNIYREDNKDSVNDQNHNQVETSNVSVHLYPYRTILYNITTPCRPIVYNYRNCMAIEIIFIININSTKMTSDMSKIV